MISHRFVLHGDRSFSAHVWYRGVPFTHQRYLLRPVWMLLMTVVVFILIGVPIRIAHMVAGYVLPPPLPLEIHDANTSDKSSYVIAAELDKKAEAVQVATLLTVIGEEAQEVFATFTWTNEKDQAKIGTVIDKFEVYCQPRKNIPFVCYRFNLI